MVTQFSPTGYSVLLWNFKSYLGQHTPKMSSRGKGVQRREPSDEKVGKKTQWPEMVRSGPKRQRAAPAVLRTPHDNLHHALNKVTDGKAYGILCRENFQRMGPRAQEQPLPTLCARAHTGERLHVLRLCEYSPLHSGNKQCLSHKNKEQYASAIN